MATLVLTNHLSVEGGNFTVGTAAMSLFQKIIVVAEPAGDARVSGTSRVQVGLYWDFFIRFQSFAGPLAQAPRAASIGTLIIDTRKFSRYPGEFLCVVDY